MNDFIYEFWTKNDFKNKREPFSGGFQSIKDAIDFLKKHGEFWKNVMNRDLILVKTRKSTIRRGVGKDFEVIDMGKYTGKTLSNIL